MTTPSPVQDFLKRYMGRLDRRLTGAEAASRRVSWARLTLVVVGSLVAFMVAQATTPATGWSVAVVVGVAFLFVVRWHDRLEQRRSRLAAWRDLKQEHLARTNWDWDALPSPTAAPLPDDHPFAADLDVTGPRSLLHLINTTTSKGGTRRLRNWLTASVPVSLDTLATRQKQVQALVPRTLLRDKLTLLSRDASARGVGRWDSSFVLRWLQQDTDIGRLRWTMWGLTGLALTNVALILGWALGALPGIWGVTLILYFAVYTYWYRTLKGLIEEADVLNGALRPLQAVLLLLERYKAPSVLQPLLDAFQASGRAPSALLKRVARTTGAVTLRDSELLWFVLNVMVPWDLIFAYRLHQHKAELREVLPAWLDAWHDLEALSALANMQWLWPEHYTLPAVGVADEAPVIDATSMGHPLLPSGQRVHNDLRIDAFGTVTLITGSNMSGKSTFLRTLGLNLMLAYAGGPVMAATFRAVPMRLFTCINVTDSVNDGISYFYAEVKRLKALLRASEQDSALPQLNLIDEIFRGTNNRERLQGSRAFIYRLSRGADVSFISTHDLELVEIADTVPSVQNKHFREEVRDGRMLFDYRLHEGPCPTTNALKIMEMEGLPVEVASDSGA